MLLFAFCAIEVVKCGIFIWELATRKNYDDLRNCARSVEKCSSKEMESTPIRFYLVSLVVRNIQIEPTFL